MAFVMNYLFVDCEMIKEKHYIIFLLMGLQIFQRKLVDKQLTLLKIDKNDLNSASSW